MPAAAGAVDADLSGPGHLRHRAGHRPGRAGTGVPAARRRAGRDGRGLLTVPPRFRAVAGQPRPRPPGRGQPAAGGGAGRRAGRGRTHRRRRGSHLRAVPGQARLRPGLRAGPPGTRPPCASRRCPRAAGAGSNSTAVTRRCASRPGSCSTWARPPRRWPPTGRPPRIQAAVGGGVLVNLGGDIRVAGDPPDGGWRVGDRRRRRLRHQHRQRPSPARWSWSATAASPRRVPLGRAWRRGDDAAAPHHRRRAPGMPARLLLAHRQRRRRELRRREHRQHRGDPARRAGAAMAGRAAACRPASSGMTARSSPWPAGRPLTRETRKRRD